MGTIELRQRIIDRLSHIDDIQFLKAIKTLVDSKAEGELYKLSEYQKERVNSRKRTIEQGSNYIS